MPCAGEYEVGLVVFVRSLRLGVEGRAVYTKCFLGCTCTSGGIETMPRVWYRIVEAMRHFCHKAKSSYTSKISSCRDSRQVSRSLSSVVERGIAVYSLLQYPKVSCSIHEGTCSFAPLFIHNKKMVSDIPRL